MAESADDYGHASDCGASGAALKAPVDLDVAGRVDNSKRRSHGHS